MDVYSVWSLSRWMYSGLWLACAALTAWRFARSPAGILMPIGSGMFFLSGISWRILPLTSRMSPLVWDIRQGLDSVFSWLAMLFIVAGIATTRAAAPRLHGATPGQTGMPGATGLAAARGGISKEFFLASAIVAGPLSLVTSTIGLLFLLFAEEPALGVVMIASSLPAGLYLMVVNCVFLYKLWASIQDGRARTSPGAAVGFLFIPVYSVYWVFQAFWGFAKDYNAFIARHSVEAPRLPEGVFLAYVILSLVSGVPFLGFLASAAAFVLWLVIVSKASDGVNALPRVGGIPSA